MAKIYAGARKLPVVRGLTGLFIPVPGRLAVIIRLSLMMQTRRSMQFTNMAQVIT